MASAPPRFGESKTWLPSHGEAPMQLATDGMKWDGNVSKWDGPFRKKGFSKTMG